MTNILVTAMLLTGGSAVLSTMTGVNTVASCFLLPIGVVLYTLFGGNKTFAVMFALGPLIPLSPKYKPVIT